MNCLTLPQSIMRQRLFTTGRITFSSLTTSCPFPFACASIRRTEADLRIYKTLPCRGSILMGYNRRTIGAFAWYNLNVKLLKVSVLSTVATLRLRITVESRINRTLKPVFTNSLQSNSSVVRVRNFWFSSSIDEQFLAFYIVLSLFSAGTLAAAIVKKPNTVATCLKWVNIVHCCSITLIVVCFCYNTMKSCFIK